MQVSRITVNGSVEMRGGYVDKISKKEGLIMRYIPDTRSVYISSVKTFYDLLRSKFKIYKNSGIEKEYEEWEKELNELSSSYKEKTKDISADKLKTERDLQMNILVEKYRDLFSILDGFASSEDYFGEVKAI